MSNIFRKQGINTGSGGGSNTNFVGTRQEWEALSSTQQNAYDTVDIIDDEESEEISVVSTYIKTLSTYGDVTLKRYSNGLKSIYFSSSTFPSTRQDFSDTIPSDYMPIIDNLIISSYDIQNNIPRGCMIKSNGTLTMFPSQNQGTGVYICCEYF